MSKELEQALPVCKSHLVVSHLLQPHGLYSPWNSSGQSTGVGSLCLLQGIFPAQKSNPGRLHWKWILYQLSHKRSPRTLEWVAFPFSRQYSRPSNQNQVSCIALKIHKSPHLSWSFSSIWHVNRWVNSGNSKRLYFGGPQNHCRWWLQPWN